MPGGPPLRDLFRERIREEKWSELFTGGCCYFFAIILHQELNLPLFYATPVGRDEFRHVFVMRGEECIDYDGSQPVRVIAKRYAEWPDIRPKTTSVAEVRRKITEKNLGQELEDELFSIARTHFARYRARFGERA